MSSKKIGLAIIGTGMAAKPHALALNELKDDINEYKTELMLKLMIMAAIYEFMFMHKTPTKVVINEYLKVADFFVPGSQKSFLNAILDKVSKISRH